MIYGEGRMSVAYLWRLKEADYVTTFHRDGVESVAEP